MKIISQMLFSSLFVFILKNIRVKKCSSEMLAGGWLYVISVYQNFAAYYDVYVEANGKFENIEIT